MTEDEWLDQIATRCTLQHHTVPRMSGRRAMR